MLFTTYDVKSETFGNLYTARTNDEAIRGFITAIQNAPRDSIIAQYPEDFHLYCVGDFDTSNGNLMQSQDYPKRLITGLEVLHMLGHTSVKSDVQSVPHKVEEDVALSTLKTEVDTSSEVICQ